MGVSVSDFNEEVEVTYKDDKYSVRDNGAILRKIRPGKRKRPLDDIWTFGKPNKKGYMIHAGARVHIIVNTAFNGAPPSKQHIVDHIDTNRQNNRPENLRWVTKLENALSNPITRRKIILVCGSIEAFLDNPRCLDNSDFDQNFYWMRTVSPDEAKVSLERMLEWAKQDKKPNGETLGEWIYGETKDKYDLKQDITSLTEGVEQRNWRTPTEFPNCPTVDVENPIRRYYENLTSDAVFSKNKYSTSNIYKTAIVDEDNTLYVLTEFEQNSIKPYGITKITFENYHFVHEAVRTFFTLEGAEKELTLLQGLDWTGGESIDDYT